MLSTALYDASDQERKITVDLLLKFGADPNAEGKEYEYYSVVHLNGLTYIHRYGNALQTAAFDGSKGIVESLLAYKADVNNREATTALLYKQPHCTGTKTLLECSSTIKPT